LWKHLATDLCELGGRKLSDLGNPNSNIFRHVRTIEVKNEFDKLPADLREPLLQALLTAIPRGQLRGFECDFELSGITLERLRQLHPKLEWVYFRNFSLWRSVLGSPWTQGLLSDVHELAIEVETTPPQLTRRLLDACPRLVGILFEKDYRTDSHPLLPAEVFLDLRNLQVPGMKKDVISFPFSRIGTLHLGESQSTMCGFRTIWALFSATST
jgi:hypothetical protein